MKAKIWYLIGAVAVVAAIVLVLQPKQKKSYESVNIILSPRYSDAAASLSGLIADKSVKTVVAAFFTGTSSDSSADYSYGYLGSKDGLSQDSVLAAAQNISKDMQALIASYAQASTTVKVYGPSDFGEGITDPDGKILHDAYVGIINLYPKPNVDFYFYEDVPYIGIFNSVSLVSIQKYLENETGFLLEKEFVPAEGADREAVYKVFRVSE